MNDYSANHVDREGSARRPDLPEITGERVSETATAFPEGLCGKIGPLEGGLKVVSQDTATVTTKLALSLKAGQCTFTAWHKGKHTWEL